MPDTLSNKKIFAFWYPLAATWLMMSVEGPLLSAIIARLPEAKYNLAAYGVAFAFALIVEAPIIMMLSAATALVKDRQSYLALRRYNYYLNLFITISMIVLLIPRFFYYLTEDIMHLPHQVAVLTHGALVILIPWPAAVGLRRFYQGILIRYNLTSRVAYGTAVRLTTMALTAFILYRMKYLSGALVGAAALSCGVLAEAAASRLMVHRTLEKVKSSLAVPDSAEPLDMRKINHFYYPLALTSMLSLAIQPLVTFMLGGSRLAIESLAVFPVINALTFIFRAIGLSYQEVAIALSGENFRNKKILGRFAFALAAVVTVIIAGIAFTPLANVWFHTVSGLDWNLTRIAVLPTQILVLMPALSVILSFQRAAMVNFRRTPQITRASAIEVGLILLLLLTCIKGLDLVGAVAAAISLLLGRLAANGYLALKMRRH